MADYFESRIAACYDRAFPPGQRADFAFYLPMIMAAGSVLDIGCGTGALLHLARDAGHTGRLTGLDPSADMLAQARARPGIEWVHGDLAEQGRLRQFDLALMTGHAFQELIGDDELRAFFAHVRDALADGGRFAFETRNPAARGWSTWTPEHVSEVVEADGTVLRMWHESDEPVGDVVTFTTTVDSDGWDRPWRSAPDSLRFLSPDALTAFVTGAGLVVEDRFGDWDGGTFKSSDPEIITIARKPG